MTASPDTLQQVKSVLQSALKIDASTDLDDDTPLIGGEYDVDSLDILLIVTELEKAFGVRIREGTMDRTAFATVRTLADFVESLRPGE
jgi:acyl carrier protein